jgi:hypothetical protein
MYLYDSRHRSLVFVTVPLLVSYHVTVFLKQQTKRRFEMTVSEYTLSFA